MQSFLKPNRKVNYGLDLTKVFVGQEIVSNYNITVDESVLSLWSGFMPTSSYPENSREFAGRLGFHQIFLPYGFLMNLSLSLTAESYGNSSIHIHEIRNVLYLSPAFPGDTFSCSIRISHIAEQNSHNYVVASHTLFNQKGEAVFLLESEMVFPHFVPRVTIASTRPQNMVNNHFKEKILARVRGIHIENKINVLKPGDLILHPYVRPVGKSENLFWATYFKDTIANHFNYQRFKPGEILVSDGIVLSMVLGIAGREFRQVLMPEIIRSFSIIPVIAEDRLGAFSFVNEVRQVMPGFEELHLTTFGLRNVDPEIELHDFSFPSDLFNDVELPNNINSILENQSPFLIDKICCMLQWKILRKSE